MRPHSFAVVFLAALAYGAEPEPASVVPPHPLVTAAEPLYQRNLPQACDELTKLTSMAPGLTDDDFIRLQFLVAFRGLDDGDEFVVRRALSQALRIDLAAELPPFASKLGKILEDARSQASGTSPKDRNSRLPAAWKAASEREPAPKALFRGADALYTLLEIGAAAVVLDLVLASSPLTTSGRAQLALRQGILKMEVPDEEALKWRSRKR